MVRKEMTLRDARLKCFAYRDLVLQGFNRTNYRDAVDDLTIAKSELRNYATLALEAVSECGHLSSIAPFTDVTELPTLLDSLGESGWLVGTCICLFLETFKTLGIFTEAVDTVVKDYQDLRKKDKDNYQKKVNDKVIELIQTFRAANKDDEATVVDKISRIAYQWDCFGFEVLDILEDCENGNFTRAANLANFFPPLRFDLREAFNRLSKQQR